MKPGKDALETRRLGPVSRTQLPLRLVPVPIGETGKAHNLWDTGQRTQKSLIEMISPGSVLLNLSAVTIWV